MKSHHSKMVLFYLIAILFTATCFTCNITNTYLANSYCNVETGECRLLYEYGHSCEYNYECISGFCTKVGNKCADRQAEQVVMWIWIGAIVGGAICFLCILWQKSNTSDQPRAELQKVLPRKNFV